MDATNIKEDNSKLKTVISTELEKIDELIGAVDTFSFPINEDELEDINDKLIEILKATNDLKAFVKDRI